MKVEINLYCVIKWVFLLIVRTILDCSQNSPLFILDYCKLLSENIQVCVGVQCHGLLVILLGVFFFFIVFCSW